MQNTEKQFFTRIKFREDLLPEINRKAYQTQNICLAELVGISENKLYFNTNFKGMSSVNKKAFIKYLYQIRGLIQNRLNSKQYTVFPRFIENIRLGYKHRFIIYQIKDGGSNFFIHLDRTLEYIKDSLMFYEYNHLKKNKSKISGIGLNKIRGGYSIGINSLVAFLPNKRKKRQVKGDKMFLKYSSKFNMKKLVKNRNSKKLFINYLSKRNRRDRYILNYFANFQIKKINFKRRNIVLKKV
jgi:ribosomal protein S1